MGEVVTNEHLGPATTIYRDGYNALFTVLGLKFNAKNGKYVTAKYNTVPESTSLFHSEPWAKWGDDNLLPQNTKEDIAKAGVMKRALKIRRDMHYGLGLITFSEEIVEGRLKIILEKMQEYEDFKKINNYDKTYLQFVGDYERYGNIFPTVIFDHNGELIACIRRLDPHHCRLERMDEKKLAIKYLYYSKNWPRPRADEYVKIPALDADFPLLDLQLKKMRGEIKPGDEFYLPVRLQEDGNTYYDETYWNCLRTTWLPIASNVPAMKLAIMRNQMTIKYHLKIPYEYWNWRYKDSWPSWDDKTRWEKVREALEEMNEFLTDIENAGKSFLSHFSTDPVSGKMIGEWKLEPIDDKLKADNYLPDSQAANSEILFATGVNGAIIGSNSPGERSDKSGSSIRESFAVMQALIAPDRLITRYPIEFVRDFNGWPQFKFGHKELDTSETLDENPTGKKTVMKT